MSFVNEFIPAEDVDKYGLKEIDKHFIVGGTNARDWTIDRDRDIYLRNVANGREDWRNQTKWTFYWRGAELTLRLDLLGGRGGARRTGLVALEAGPAQWQSWIANSLEGA